MIIPKTVVIHRCIDEELKERATKVLSTHGLGIDEAIRLFLKEVVRSRGMPFEKTPSIKTARALVQAGEPLRKFGSVDEMFDALSGAVR